MSKYAYETELSFLLQHMHQIKVAQANCPEIVCDFSIEQDYAYALNNLTRSEQFSFSEVYQESVRQITPPDLIIFLQCPAHILLKRIHERGRANEATIDLAYLNNTVHALKNRVFQLKSRVVILDSNQCDFRKQDDMKRVMAEILI